MEGRSVTKGLFWKLLERFGVSGIQFVLQLVLARLLTPDLYGVLSIMLVFINLANVFIQTGFNTALIQNKDVTERDYSSVLWVSCGVAGILYTVIFFTAPLVGMFYEMPEITAPLRVLALMLFPGALNSVQLAKVSRDMDFKKVFFSNLGGMILAGGVGILIACLGGGLWALVAQQLINVVTACLVMRLTVKLKVQFVCDFKRIRVLFAYGWKLLLSSLLDTLYQDLRSLVIGKKYGKAELGFYNRGKHFPTFIMNAVNGAVQSVMLPAMSAKQDEKAEIKRLTRSSLSLGAYVIFPLMAGLAAVSTPLINILLTEKWLPCVPYLMIYCVTTAFYPVHSCNLQAINAQGRSDLFLILEIIKKVIGVGSLVIAVFCFNSPIAIALTGIVTTVISFFVNAYPNKKLLGYTYWEQICDLLPATLLSLTMFGTVYVLILGGLSHWLTLLIQVPVGVVLYVSLSILFRVKNFDFICLVIKKNVIGKLKKHPQC